MARLNADDDARRQILLLLDPDGQIVNPPSMRCGIIGHGVLPLRAHLPAGEIVQISRAGGRLRAKNVSVQAIVEDILLLENSGFRSMVDKGSVGILVANTGDEVAYQLVRNSIGDDDSPREYLASNREHGDSARV